VAGWESDFLLLWVASDLGTQI